MERLGDVTCPSCGSALPRRLLRSEVARLIRLRGQRGARKANAHMTPEERTARAQRAATVRWERAKRGRMNADLEPQRGGRCEED